MITFESSVTRQDQSINGSSHLHRPLVSYTAYLVVLLALTSCARDVVVTQVTPSRAAQRGGSSALDTTAVSENLHTLRTDHNPGDRQTATANLIDLFAPSLLEAPHHSLVAPSASGHPVRTTLRRGAGPGGLEPSQFTNLQPTDRFRVVDKTGQTSVGGIGVPLVGSLRPVDSVHVPGPAPTQPITGAASTVTAVPVVIGDQLYIDLYDPHVTGKDGAGERLAGDYTTATALVYSRFVRQSRGLHGFISGSSSYSSAGIYPSEKPSTDKTPLILVHGLLSDPTDFYVLHANLEKDPEFRRRYQVWYFYYPSSLPVPASAQLLREDVEYFIHKLDPRGVHPALHRAILVGHSMGGLLCRLAVSDGGERYYRHFFTKPLSSLDVTSKQREFLQSIFFYRACPDVKTVIFISTPHRGSALAGGLLGNIGRLLVRLPVTVRATIHDIVVNNRNAFADKSALRPVTSLDTLSPRDPLIAAVNDMPIHAGVDLHSILGNNKHEGPLEQSSDGAVPYSSSHLPQAQSEIIVPAGHTGTLKRTESATEIERIADR